jgi:hypothetical protein
MPSRRKGKALCQRKQQREKNGSDAQRSAPKHKARGSHCLQGKGNRRRSKLTITNPDAAGIDVGAQVHYAAVPEGRDQVSVWGVPDIADRRECS